MEIFRFKNLEVYRQAKFLYGKIMTIPNLRQDRIIEGQIKRAALSIILNIAEGSGRDSDKDFSRFLKISIGSTNEVVACLDIMKDTCLINQEQFDIITKDCEIVSRQLGAFIKTLRKKNLF